LLHSAKTGLISRAFSLLGQQEVAIPIKEHGVVKAEWLSFACVLLRGSMIKDIGLMDEKYFMYREDNDYCRRAGNADWSLEYCDTAKVIHLNQGDSNQTVIKRLPRYYFASRSRYFMRYYGKIGLFMANIFWSIGRIISLLREFLEKKPAVFHRKMLKDIWIGFNTHYKE
jgi:GT2 family glycosyltransferase